MITLYETKDKCLRILDTIRIVLINEFRNQRPGLNVDLIMLRTKLHFYAHDEFRPPTPLIFPVYHIICIGCYKESISRNPPVFPINRTYFDIYILFCESILLSLNKIKILYQ